jgi:GNAT superfamily N-acetyltransferase
MESRKDQLLFSTDKSLLQLEVIHPYLSQESYWAQNLPVEILERSISNSLCFGVYDNGRQIAFARIISDFATFAWLADVFVLESHRGKGISKWMMENITTMPELQGLRKWMLGTRDAHGLYEKYGFTPLKNPGRFMEKHNPDVYQLSDS